MLHFDPMNVLRVSNENQSVRPQTETDKVSVTITDSVKKSDFVVTVLMQVPDPRQSGNEYWIHTGSL
jgi:hypothetical protein